jgi:hypothetical protein
MNLREGDLVICPPSGPHRGNRIGKIIEVRKNKYGSTLYPILVGYIDYPLEHGGWYHPIKQWVRPISKITFPKED